MQVRIVCPTLLLVGALVGCGTSGPRLSADEQKLLMGASAAADVVVRGDDKSVDVMNNTVLAEFNVDLYFKSLELEQLDTTTAELRAGIKEYQRSYYWTAKKYCQDRGLLVDNSRTKIGRNTIHYQCYTDKEFGFLKLKETHSYCEGKFPDSGDPLPGGRWSDAKIAPTVMICGNFGPRYCSAINSVFKGVQNPTCGFVRKLMEEHLANAARPAPTTPTSNNLGFAKEKCKELGFAENTEAYGNCVLRLSR